MNHFCILLLSTAVVFSIHARNHREALRSVNFQTWDALTSQQEEQWEREREEEEERERELMEKELREQEKNNK